MSGTWKNRTVVVTGACGFIGSHLVEQLVHRGARVRALAFYEARGGRGWLDDLAPEVLDGVEVISGDVRDAEFMRRLVRRSDVVFHLAALIGIPYSYDAPRSYIDTNVTGTLNVLEAARDGGCSRVLVTSTSEVYGTAQRVPIDEDHPLQAQSPYSASKIGAEKLAESYFRSFELPVTVLRPFNTYGPRQSPRAVIPTILLQLLAGKKTLSLGDVTTTRDFNFVGDTAAGMIRLAECRRAVGQAVNIGTGREATVAQVAQAAARMLATTDGWVGKGRKISIQTDTRRLRPGRSEVRRLCADHRRLRRLTGWVPSTTLEDGLRVTMEWFRQRSARYEFNRYYV